MRLHDKQLYDVIENHVKRGQTLKNTAKDSFYSFYIWP